MLEGDKDGANSLSDRPSIALHIHHLTLNYLCVHVPSSRLTRLQVSLQWQQVIYRANQEVGTALNYSCERQEVEDNIPFQEARSSALPGIYTITAAAVDGNNMIHMTVLHTSPQNLFLNRSQFHSPQSVEKPNKGIGIGVNLKRKKKGLEVLCESVIVSTLNVFSACAWTYTL